MSSESLLVFMVTLVVCSFCGIEFPSVGRHIWRCKQRNDGIASSNNNQGDENSSNSEQIPAGTIHRQLESIKCACGRTGADLRGLRAHQRACKAIKNLHHTTIDENVENNSTHDDIINDEEDIGCPDNASFKSIKSIDSSNHLC